MIGTAIAALSNLDFPLYTVSPNSVCPVTAASMVTAMTWERVEAAARASPSYRA